VNQIYVKIQKLSIDAVYGSLDTRPKGLSRAEAYVRLGHYGQNVLHEIKGKPLFLKLLANFIHLMAVLLWVGGAVALAAGMPQLGIAVWMVNVINGAFSFWQEYRAEQATEALMRLLPSRSRVLRDGEEVSIRAEELVPGDIILISEGDRLSADVRLVQTSELHIDQSTLTGESHPVIKSSDPVFSENLPSAEIQNLAFAGSIIASGTGKAAVFATGMNTQIGRIAGMAQNVAQDMSPLQRELITVTKVVTAIALAIGVVFFILAAAVAGITPAESFIFALGMIVAFVPEGLLPTVTLSLAMGTKRMADRHALIKKLSAVETLGCTTVICTDKTGTLTQNEMTVRNIWLGAGRFAVTGTGYTPEGKIRGEDGGNRTWPLDEPPGKDLYRFLLAAAMCNNARLLPAESSPTPSLSPTRWGILGDPTEAALKVAAIKGGLDLVSEERRLPRQRELPFESRRKRMSTIHWTTGNDPLEEGAGIHPGSLIAFVKGAPKEVLDLSTRIRLNGQDVLLNDNWREKIMAANDAYAIGGLRVLAAAQHRFPVPAIPVASGESAWSPEKVESDMTFLGLAALMDPPRPEVTQAVLKCTRAGIRVVMITGDYGLTAETIARRIGIIQSDRPRIVTGVELDTMDDRALTQVLAEEVIFARVSPEHKLRVVSVLQEMGNVVAVTGDGVNDSPALKKADIGVAMGLSGTDVAKEAADMILTDDNFATIVNAIEEGRSVYANIKKFASYIFTSNTPEAVPFILFALSGGRIPLAINVMHVLSIDVGTDIVPALALGAELPEPGVMDRPPRKPGEHVITRSLLFRSYLWLGLVQSTAAMAAFYFMYWTNGYWGCFLDIPAEGPLYRSATAMALAAVVTTQIGNLFAHRSEHVSAFRIPFFNNPILWAGIATELALVVMIIYTPLFQNFIGTNAFPLMNWIFLFAWTPALLFVDEARKIFMDRKKRKT